MSEKYLHEASTIGDFVKIQTHGHDYRVIGTVFARIVRIDNSANGPNASLVIPPNERYCSTQTLIIPVQQGHIKIANLPASLESADGTLDVFQPVPERDVPDKIRRQLNIR